MFDDTDPTKRQRARDLVSRSLEHQTGCISFQVVQETLNVLVQKLGANLEDAAQLLEDVLIPMWRISPHSDVVQTRPSLEGTVRLQLLRLADRSRGARSGLHTPLQRRPATRPANSEPDHREPVQGLMGIFNFRNPGVRFPPLRVRHTKSEVRRRSPRSNSPEDIHCSAGRIDVLLHVFARISLPAPDPGRIGPLCRSG